MEKQQLEKYINEYGRDIYLFCKRLTQNKNTADDLYQEKVLVQDAVKPFAGKKTADSGAFVLHGKSESSRDCGADARIGQQYKKVN